MPNDDYNWPIVVITDYNGDRVSISEGTIAHIKRFHPSDFTNEKGTVELVAQVLIKPDGGVYRNKPDHPHPHRLNYYSAPSDTEKGPLYLQVVVDKVLDPCKVITAYSTDRIGNHGECIYHPW